jgi:hypothetical protein
VRFCVAAPLYLASYAPGLALCPAPTFPSLLSYGWVEDASHPLMLGVGETLRIWSDPGMVWRVSLAAWLTMLVAGEVGASVDVNRAQALLAAQGERAVGTAVAWSDRLPLASPES